MHLIVDLYGASRLDDLEFIRRTLIECVEAAGATLLNVFLFMCGKTRPERCVEVLWTAFAPQRIVVEEILRGRAS